MRAAWQAESTGGLRVLVTRIQALASAVMICSQAANVQWTRCRNDARLEVATGGGLVQGAEPTRVLTIHLSYCAIECMLQGACGIRIRRRWSRGSLPHALRPHPAPRSPRSQWEQLRGLIRMGQEALTGEPSCSDLWAAFLQDQTLSSTAISPDTATPAAAAAAAPLRQPYSLLPAGCPAGATAPLLPPPSLSLPLPSSSRSAVGFMRTPALLKRSSSAATATAPH